MRVRFLFVFAVVLSLAACNGMPTWMAGGSQPPPLEPPPADVPDVPADDAVGGGPSAEPAGGEVDAGDVLTAVAPLLPAPWSWLVPLIGVTAVALVKKGK